MLLTPNAYALLGLTAIVAVLIAVMTYALMHFANAARQTRKNLRAGSLETALMSAALQDAVTKLKAQERATAARADASERLSEEIIAGLTAGLAVVGVGGDVRSLNPAGRRMLDLAEGATPEEFRAALDGMLLTGVIDECLDSGAAVVRRVVTLPAPFHGVSDFGVTVSPLFDDRRQLQGAICLFTDLTDVKDLEEQLRLKDSLATVGELTAGIAHEFRNGLATIHGYSKLIDLAQLPEAYRPYVQGIRAETDSLSQVVTNFLNFARPAQLTLAEVDLRAICERAAEEVRADARLGGGDASVRGEFGRVWGDEVLLKQAFSNLLRNALEACVGASRPPQIDVHAEIDRTQRVVRVTVDDNGPGIPVDMRERVFRPFVTSKRTGTGLGLALVQKIIVFHNGRIVAAASPQGGASLQVALPLFG
ncbi:MAG TPA: ATP-binding protein [Vicinamibacterales bacterium]|jgi:signal transduction histidine kinase|nr:ATP-binding protein [Vicinamibacterales bacterium]